MRPCHEPFIGHACVSILFVLVSTLSYPMPFVGHNARIIQKGIPSLFARHVDTGRHNNSWVLSTPGVGDESFWSSYHDKMNLFKEKLSL